MKEAQVEAKKFAELLRALPDLLRGLDSFELNLEALQGANVAGSAVSAIDAATWQAEALAANQ
jgi:L-alanine-DL-glutamate epimerase-like enolase superfamily enzyme